MQSCHTSGPSSLCSLIHQDAQKTHCKHDSVPTIMDDYVSESKSKRENPCSSLKLFCQGSCHIVTRAWDLKDCCILCISREIRKQKLIKVNGLPYSLVKWKRGDMSDFFLQFLPACLTVY